MSAVAFTEALREFQEWDAARARTYMTGATANYQPRQRAGKLVKSQRPARPKVKTRRDDAPARGVYRELRRCTTVGCQRTYCGADRRCSACRKAMMPTHPCVEGCGTIVPHTTRRCRPCKIAYYANTHPPCECGKLAFTKGKCRTCYQRERLHRDPLARERQRECCRRHDRKRDKLPARKAQKLAHQHRRKALAASHYPPT